MAKRDRVPRHKSHQHKRNKNPKLSPFQREQKRDRLANQAPLQKDVQRPYSSGQRKLYEYFQEREAREAQKRETRRLLREEKKASGVAAPPAAPEISPSTNSSSSSATTSVPYPKKRKREDSNNLSINKRPRVEIASLNEEFKSKIVGSTTLTSPDPTLALIQKRKAKKHEKKLEQRKERGKARQAKAEADLQVMLRDANTKKKKKNNSAADDIRDRDKAYEKELRIMQAKKALEDAEAAAVKLKEEQAAATAAASAARKRIQFDETNTGEPSADPEHRAMRFPGDVRASTPKVKDFDQMIDIVRFGERVEAPPVLDVVPDKKSSVSKIASKMEKEQIVAEAERKRRNIQIMKDTMAKKNEARYSYNNLVVPIGAGLSSDGLPLRPSELASSHSSSSTATTSAAKKRALSKQSLVDQRYALLSGNSTGTSNPGGLAERKRLASLGLAPRVTENVSGATQDEQQAHGAGGGAKPNEFELLRQRVMECYQKGKVRRNDGKQSIDLKHHFPAI